MDKKINIIVVDDNPAFLEGIASFLEKDGKYNIMAKFSSGKELLDYNDLQMAQLILLDIEMPEMNGIEAATRLNFMHPDMKIIAITMYQDKVYLKQLVESGFKGFVNKVTVPEGLFETINAVLDNQFRFPLDIKI